MVSAPPSELASAHGPVTSFSYTLNGGLAAFTNSSTDATSYLWDFGDNGATSTDENTHHTYPATGTYTVTLTATNACGSTDSTETINIDVVGIDAVLADADLRVYPVPAVYEVNVQFAHPSVRMESVRLESMTGQVVYMENVTAQPGAFQTRIGLDGVAAGTYFLKLQMDEGLMVRKLVVQ